MSGKNRVFSSKQESFDGKPMIALLVEEVRKELYEEPSREPKENTFSLTRLSLFAGKTAVF